MTTKMPYNNEYDLTLSDGCAGLSIPFCNEHVRIFDRKKNGSKNKIINENKPSQDGKPKNRWKTVCDKMILKFNNVSITCTWWIDKKNKMGIK